MESISSPIHGRVEAAPGTGKGFTSAAYLKGFRLGLYHKALKMFRQNGTCENAA